MSEETLKGCTLFRRGKVRDVYDAGDALVLVASDRVSAFDVVLPTPIPDKGKVLTQISKFWFSQTTDIVNNHLISMETKDLPAAFQPYAAQLEGRFMLVRKCAIVPYECIVRGYLVGSGWSEYTKSGTVCGMPLPAGLQQAQKLPQPIFTPSTKAEAGHDINVSFDVMCKDLGIDLAESLKALSLKLYVRARDIAEKKGVIIADTKFEFGLLGGKIMLADEVLTPDSSRFWPAATYRVGSNPESFDKQFIRDYLESLDWDKTPPGPALPPEVIAKTQEKYRAIVKILTGKDL